MGNLLAAMSWLHIAVDDALTVTRWNDEAERLFGVPATRALGQRFIESGIKWDWHRALSAVAECRVGQATKRLDDLAYERADGKRGCLSIALAPLPGSARGALVLVGADVSERRILEEQLAQAQKLESIGQLAAGVAHEMNTPIQFVGDNVTFLETAFGGLQRLLVRYRKLREAARAGAATLPLVEEITAAETEAELEYLMTEMPRAFTQTLEGITRVATIVRALKAYSHPDDTTVAADVNQMILRALTIARNEMKYVAEVETNLGRLPHVVCNPWELSQTFLNLLVNAAHAVADKVNGSGERGRIRVTTSVEGDSVVVAVSDTGMGIAPEVQPRVFEPFFTTKTVGRGTGQGLSIAHSIVVDKLGGALWFETAPGQGSTFFVRLPTSRS